MIDGYKDQIIKEIDSLYVDNNSNPEDTSIIFHLDGAFYLSIYNDKVKYIFNKEKNLYQNIIFELQVRKKLSLFNSYYFYIDSVKKEDLSAFYTKKGHNNPNSIFVGQVPALPQFEPTGVIFELEDQSKIFQNLDILTDYFLDRDVSKEEIYSLMISPSFSYAMEEAVPTPKSSDTPKSSRFVDLTP